MNKDRVKGAVNDAAGRVKRQVGEWTGDSNAQVEGSVQQIKGKAQKAWGTMKDAARGANANMRQEHETDKEREAEERRKEESQHSHSEVDR